MNHFILSVVGFICTQKNWLPFIWVKIYLNQKHPNTFTSADHVLLKQLGWIGLKKEEGQTLFAYAKKWVTILKAEEVNNSV